MPKRIPPADTAALAWTEDCHHLRPEDHGYNQMASLAEYKDRQRHHREKQRYCNVCRRWIWSDLYHEEE